MRLTVEFNEGLIGEWFAKILELPGIVSYGESPNEALARVQAQALHQVADMMECGNLPPEPVIAFNQFFNELELDRSTEDQTLRRRKSDQAPVRA